MNHVAVEGDQVKGSELMRSWRAHGGLMAAETSRYTLPLPFAQIIPLQHYPNAGGIFAVAAARV